MKIIGSFVSPYVRKVLACMHLKGLSYEIDPITPFFGNDEFRRLSPLCRIPVLVDGDFAACDSSVICAYLDEAYQGRPLLPADPKDRAHARWLEEFADTRLGDLFIWGLFYQKVVHPASGANPATSSASPGRSQRMRPKRSIILKASFPSAAGCSATSASRTSPLPAFSVTPPMQTSSPTRTAGPASRPSFGEPSTRKPSRRHFRSRTSSAASISRADARRFSKQELR